jgi:hypothetical protein
VNRPQLGIIKDERPTQLLRGAEMQPSILSPRVVDVERVRKFDQ